MATASAGAAGLYWLARQCSEDATKDRRLRNPFHNNHGLDLTIDEQSHENHACPLVQTSGDPKPPERTMQVRQSLVGNVC